MVKIYYILAFAVFALPWQLFGEKRDNKDWFDWDMVAELPDFPEEAFIGNSGGQLLIVGGMLSGEAIGDDSYSDRILLLHSENEGEPGLQEVGRLPFPMASGAVVSTPDGMLCIGGRDRNGALKGVVSVAWDAGLHEARIELDFPELPHATVGAAAVYWNGNVYLAGGKVDGRASLQFLTLDVKDSDAGWAARPSWPGRAVYNAELLAQNGAERPILLLFGGRSEAEAEASAYRYDIEKEQWRSAAPLPERVGNPVGASLGASHIIAMDSNENGGSDAPLLAYQTIVDSWAELPMRAKAFSRAQFIGVADGNLQVLGTNGRKGQYLRGTTGSSASRFQSIDYVALFGYLVMIVIVGLYFSKRGSTTNDYFLAGNNIPWWAAGVSLMATQVSSIGFMAVPAKTFATNWAYFLGVLTWFIVVPIVTRFFIPYFRRYPVASAYSYLEIRFNVFVRLFAAISFSAMQVGRLAIVLLLPSLALATVTDMSLNLCIVLMGVVATVYTITGGMAAVVWTDVVQAVLLIAGALFAIATVFWSMDDGFETFARIVSEDRKMDIISPTADIGSAAAWVIVVGNIFSRFSTLTSDQSVVQRYLTTPNAKDSRRALWLDVAASVPWALIAFLLGTALYVFYKENPSLLHPAVGTDSVVPLFIVQALPPGVSGILIAAIFAAAMSSLDSSMHSTSTVLVSDVYIRFWPESSERARMFLARGIVLILGVFGTLAAVYLAHVGVGSIWDQFIAIVGLFVGVLAGLFLLGIFTSRVDGWDVLLGAAFGAIVTFLVSQSGRVSFFLYPAFGIATCFVVGYLSSWVPRRRALVKRDS